MNKQARPNFAEINFDETIKKANEFAARRGIPAAVVEQPSANVHPIGGGDQAKAVQEALRKYTLTLPAYILDEVQKRALESKRTTKSLILEGLKAVGIHVKDEDLVMDGRRDDAIRP